MMYFLIWLVGALIIYTLEKLVNSDSKKDNTWSDVRKRFFLSLLSWVALIIGVICFLILVIAGEFDKGKPPRWL